MKNTSFWTLVSVVVFLALCAKKKYPAELIKAYPKARYEQNPNRGFSITKVPMMICSFVARRLHRQLAKQGYSIVPRTAANDPTLPVLELLVEYMARDLGFGSIIQIGAHDGILDDPVQQIIRQLKLPALLVEPMPNVFDRLCDHYSDHTNIEFSNVAISEQPGHLTLYRMRSDAPVPEWVHGLASFDKQVLLKHRDWPDMQGVDLEQYLESLTVPVMTIAELLAKHPDLPSPLLLQIDTEGHDLQVLRSAVAAGCLPPIINYEHKHLSYAEQLSARELLSAQGYAFLGGVEDTLAVRKPTKDDRVAK